MFAAILFIPQYQQIVRGYSPTKSGLAMLPLIAGLMLASVVSGRLITRYGRYKPFPIFGTIMIALGVWLFSHLTLTTSVLVLSGWMFIIGIGLGSFMQVTTLAVQNAVDRKQLGTATSTVTFFRSIGGSIGGAIFGTILLTRLTHHLTETLPPAYAQHISTDKITATRTSQLSQLPHAIQTDILQAFVRSFSDMFLLALPFMVLAFIASLYLRESPLKTHRHSMEENAAFLPEPEK